MGDIRSARLKIDIPLGVACRTISAWTSACNHASQVAYENGCVSNAIRLQGLCYKAIRDMGLSSQVAVSCVRHVAAKYATARTSKIKIKAPLRFKRQGVVLQGGSKGRDVSMRDTGLSLWTIDGRIKRVKYQCRHEVDVKIRKERIRAAELNLEGRIVYLTVFLDADPRQPCTHRSGIAGVDFGINVMACVTDGTTHWMHSGASVSHVREKYVNTRSSLQRKKAKQPTRSIAKVLKRLSGREARFMRGVNHRVSKSIATFCDGASCATVAIEDLTGIRRSKNIPRRLKGALARWPFGSLARMLTYKCSDLGMDVIAVPPQFTSRTCNRCGDCRASNRKGNAFLCRSCGHRNHADINAALNIRSRGKILSVGTPLVEDGHPSERPEVRKLIHNSYGRSGQVHEENRGYLTVSSLEIVSALDKPEKFRV